MTLRYIDHATMARVLLVAATFVVTCMMQGCYISPEGKAKIKELQELAGQMEKFPDFQQVDYSQVSNSDATIIAYFYKSAAPFDQVREFYTRTLLAKRWSRTPDDKALRCWTKRTGAYFTFFKGQYRIDVEHAGDLAHQYAIDYGWCFLEPEVNILSR